jgi:hypothetical protein
MRTSFNVRPFVPRADRLKEPTELSALGGTPLVYVVRSEWLKTPP